MSVDTLNDQEILSMLAEKDLDSSKKSQFEEIDTVIKENKFSNRLSATLNNEIRQSERQELMINLAKAKVFDKMNLLNQIPDIKVPVPPGEGEQGAFESQFNTYFYYNLWQYSDIASILQHNGFCLSAYGTAITVVWPDFNDKRAKITVRDPKTMSGELLAYSNSEYAWLAFTYEMTGRQVIDRFPTAKGVKEVGYNSNKVTIREFFTPNKRLFFVTGSENGKAWSSRIPKLGVKHDLGFIPIRVTPNKIVPGELFGDGDVWHIFGAQDNYNEILHLYAEQLRDFVDPPMVLEKAEALPGTLPTDRGAVFEAEEGGKVYYVQKPGSGFEVNQHLGSMSQMMREVSNFPPSRSGMPVGTGTVTGKGQFASQSSVTADVDSLNRTVGKDLVLIDSMAKKIEKKLFPKVKQRMYVALSIGKGEKGDIAYYYPEDLSDYNEHILKFYPMGYDKSMELINNLQAKGQGIVSTRYVQENMPGVNPDEQAELIKAEREEEMQLMAAQQALMNPQPQGQAPPGQAQDESFAMEQGAMPPPPPGMMEGQ